MCVNGLTDAVRRGRVLCVVERNAGSRLEECGRYPCCRGSESCDREADTVASHVDESVQVRGIISVEMGSGHGCGLVLWIMDVLGCSSGAIRFFHCR